MEPGMAGLENATSYAIGYAILYRAGRATSRVAKEHHGTG